MDLFTADAQWANAAGRIQILKLYNEWVMHATDAELKQVVADLNRRGIAIALETGALTPSTLCGRGVEGFFSRGRLDAARRIKAAGGTVRFVALDEPFVFGSIYSGPSACRWSAERVAREVKDYIKAIKTVFPGVVVGDIEPLRRDMDVDELKSWLDTYRAVIGSYPPFFHLDLDFSRPDWSEAAKELETFAHERGIEFGILYFGSRYDSSDEDWMAHAEDRIVTYEAQAGGRPDHVIFQSWHDHPDYLLPESNPTTFTHLINRYFRARTVLSLEVSSRSQDGSREATGTLTDAADMPLVGAPVELSAKPLDGPGQFAEYTLSGIVPAGATQAVVGFRVNKECGCAGTSDFVLQEVRYFEGGKTNRVPNADFSRKLEGWSLSGTGRTRLESSDRGNGSMLHVMAMPTESATLNSTPFPVTPGATYILTFAARVSPTSIDSGYFGIFFLGPSMEEWTGTSEVKRKTIPLKPAVILVYSTTADRNGVFRFSLAELPPNSLLLQAKYPGNDHYWPAYAEETIGRSQ